MVALTGLALSLAAALTGSCSRYASHTGYVAHGVCVSLALAHDMSLSPTASLKLHTQCRLVEAKDAAVTRSLSQLNHNHAARLCYAQAADARQSPQEQGPLAG